MAVCSLPYLGDLCENTKIILHWQVSCRMVSWQWFFWYCTISSLIIRIVREHSFTLDIRNRAVTDPSRKRVIPICKVAIAKYFWSTLKDNPYLTCTSKVDWIKFDLFKSVQQKKVCWGFCLFVLNLLKISTRLTLMWFHYFRKIIHIILLGFIRFKQFRDAQTRKITLILPFLLSSPLYRLWLLLLWQSNYLIYLIIIFCTAQNKFSLPVMIK